jgi:hypothetical protein
MSQVNNFKYILYAKCIVFNVKPGGSYSNRLGLQHGLFPSHFLTRIAHSFIISLCILLFLSIAFYINVAV